MRITIKAAFRFNTKSNEIEMFYYDIYGALTCVSLSEGHSRCCYDYYLGCKPPSYLLCSTSDKWVKGEIEKFKALYKPDEIIEMKRLKR